MRMRDLTICVQMTAHCRFFQSVPPAQRFATSTRTRETFLRNTRGCFPDGGLTIWGDFCEAVTCGKERADERSPVTA